MHISVLIATCNRSASLRETLSDLADQTTEGAFTYEVIVADNNSSDETAAVVKKLAKTYLVPLTYLFEPRQGKAYALNRGVAAARGEVLAFTDDDVSVGPGWLAAIHRTFQEDAADGVGGPVKAQWIGVRPRWLSDRLLRQLGVAEHGPVTFQVTSTTTPFIGPNCAYRKALFSRFGGFNTEAGCAEDSEWFWRALHAGCRLMYQPQALVAHKLNASAITPRTIQKRFYRHGAWCALRWSGRSLCGAPLWVAKHVILLHGQTFWAWLRGHREDARWHWLRRHYYLGILKESCHMWWRGQPKLPPIVK